MNNIKENTIEIGKLYKALNKILVFSEGVGWSHILKDELIVFVSIEKPKKYREKPIYIFQILNGKGQLVVKVESLEITCRSIEKYTSCQ